LGFLFNLNPSDEKLREVVSYQNAHLLLKFIKWKTTWKNHKNLPAVFFQTNYPVRLCFCGSLEQIFIRVQLSHHLIQHYFGLFI